MHWQWIALGYVSYLAATSLTRREFARARTPLIGAAIAAWLGWSGSAVLAGERAALGPVLLVVLPSLVLVGGYWLSGLLFVQSDPRIERWLRAVDDRLLAQTG